MLPPMAVSDRRDICLGNAIVRAENADRYPTLTRCTNGQHIRLCQFRLTVPRASRRVQIGAHLYWGATADRPTLPHHVGGIISRGAEEEVIGSDARRVVAPMEHQHPIRDRSIGEFPSNAVGKQDTASNTEPAVSLGVPRCVPRPASIGLLDLRPKPSIDRARTPRLYHTGTRAVLKAASLQTPIEWGVAELAGILSQHREPPSLGVTPSAVCGSARALLRLQYTTSRELNRSEGCPAPNARSGDWCVSPTLPVGPDGYFGALIAVQPDGSTEYKFQLVQP